MCIGASRDEFNERFVRAVKALKVGDPSNLVDIGPKFSASELDKVENMVSDAVQERRRTAHRGS